MLKAELLKINKKEGEEITAAEVQDLLREAVKHFNRLKATDVKGITTGVVSGTYSPYSYSAKQIFENRGAFMLDKVKTIINTGNRYLERYDYYDEMDL